MQFHKNKRKRHFSKRNFGGMSLFFTLQKLKEFIGEMEYIGQGCTL